MCIIIKGRGNDQWVSNAKIMCEIDNVRYSVVDLNKSENHDIHKELQNTNIRLPAIYKNDRYIGGYYELQQWLITHKTEELNWKTL